MLYAIIARDIPASQERRLASRPAHLARLEQLKEEGRLVLAGPHPAIDSNDPGAAGFFQTAQTNGLEWVIGL